MDFFVNNINERITYKDEFFYEHQIKSPPIVRPHVHDTYELYLFISGDAKYIVEGNSYDLNKYDLMLTNRKEVHSTIFSSDKQYEKVSIHIKPSFLSEFISKDFNPFNFFENRPMGTNNKINGDLVVKNNLTGIVYELSYYYTHRDLPENVIMLKVKTIELLIKISNILNFHYTAANVQNDKIKNLIIYVNENISKKLTLEELSKEFFLSVTYISEIFKKSTGQTFNEYVAQKRVVLSKSLISKNFKFDQIAKLCGFNDYSNFYRTFKKITGISPSEFKNNLFIK